MFVNFESVTMHNFLSYGHSTIDLRTKNYCLVRGINKNPLDLASSNGSGKSSWSSAICWCLTGETVEGLHSNLKNIWIDEDLCYVTLLFSVDNVKFELTRFVAPKSDLKLKVNGVDKSGKGIRETSAILAGYLPDLTSQLLSSVIVLGQGLPGKFTNNTPSGRKESLEKLSQSDFMIQDIKTRLSQVIDENNKALRVEQDFILAKEAEKKAYETQKQTLEEQLEGLKNPPDFSSLIENMEHNIKELQNQIEQENLKVKSFTNQLNEHNSKLNNLTAEKNELIGKENADFISFQTAYNKKVSEITTDFNSKKTDLNKEYTDANNAILLKYNQSKIDLSTNIKVLESEIVRINSIKDVCPTCGQKLIGVTKPDVAPKKAELLRLKESLNAICQEESNQTKQVLDSYNKNLNSITESFNSTSNSLATKYKENEVLLKNTISSIEESYSKDITDLKYEIKKLYDSVDLYTKDVALKNSKLLTHQKQLSDLQLQQSNYTERLSKCKEQLLSIDNKLKNFEDEILYSNNKKTMVEDKLAIDSKINTLVKRDFRGFLLSNVISFIDKKVKEYASFIFGSDKLDFTLEGNNINITYLGKAFENLSGGEKQKVDLIIQFAIRDMMSEYLQFSSNILILDEIFDNLDGIGCNNVINLISKKLNDVESLFIISHHASELQISYDCEMVIEKDSNGISKVV